ncbi:MAG TPA: lipase family protein [Roseiarcus sp.]|jgi:pimeloyl-ACP methyl ester carboxylesterase
MLTHHDLSLLAKAAYSGPQSLTVGDARACLVPRGDELVVVCPGTHPSQLADWIRDLDWWPEWFAPIGLCHRGFGSGAAALWARISPELPPNGSVTYCGHSLGGALAQGLAAYHAARRLQPFRLVTFGAPRMPTAGNMTMRRLVHSGLEAVEYRRAGDIVPDLPSRLLFRHPTAGLCIGVSVPALDPAVNHSIDRYAADLAALGV